MTKGKKAYFEPVDLKVDFPKLEKKLLQRWYEKGVIRKYLTRNKSSKKFFSFLDGPITANNPMGVHHAWGRTYKDLWQRFKNMQGFKQRFQNGFDAQGLWVEVEVEKELGFKSKKDIEDFGIAKFVQLCRDRVKKYSAIQVEQSQRLGYFMDWDHSYYTLSDDNNYMIWHFLKKCHEKGWIYKGSDSVPWCPRCETAISQHEMLTEDYKEVAHESVYLTFPLVGTKDEYFLVWTTTPWTIPANISIAVDENLEYALIEVAGKKYWLAKDAVARVMSPVKYKVIKTVRGSKLTGIKYRGAFDDLPAVAAVAAKFADKFHHVIATDERILPVVISEGTGLIHTAVSAGSEDFKLGKKLGLPMILVINDDASYLNTMGPFSGLNAKRDPKLILNYLKKLEQAGEHFCFKIENYTHRYPACWRCKTELVWKVTDEWYIAMDIPSKIPNDKFQMTNEVKDTRTLRERMKDVAGRINWIPGFGLDREMDWLTNMHDWLISKKNRYWGLALPIWECPKCGNFEVIGSKEELSERSITGRLKGSPHKPQIDKIKIECSRCGAEARRIEPVGNPWLDAGVVAYSTVSEDNQAANFEPKKTRPLYLSDKDSWRRWFPADFITESFPGQFKNWFYALIAMSTVMENTEPMKTVLGFGTLLGEDSRPMHKSWGNMIEFNEGADKIGVDVMRWMYARQNPADNLLFGYKVADEVRRRFHLKLWNVYNFLVTYANLDNWKPGRSLSAVSGKQSILDKWILTRLDQTVQIVTQSLEKFDAYTASGEIEKLVDDLSLWYVRRSRDRVGPAAESENDKKAFYHTTYYTLLAIVKLLAPFTPFLAEIIYRNLTKKESVHLEDWPHFIPLRGTSRGTAKLVEEMFLVRQIVEKAHAMRKEKGIPVRQPLASFSTQSKSISRNLEYLIKGEINVKKIIWSSKSDKLNTEITKELEEEMKARELVRLIQEKRKKMNLNLTQKIMVWSDWIPTDTKLTQWVLKKAQVANLTKGKFRVVRTLDA